MHISPSNFTFRHSLLPRRRPHEFPYLTPHPSPLISKITFLSLPPEIQTITNELNLTPANSQAKLNPNTLTLIDRNKQQVHRLALNPIGEQNIQINFDFLSTTKHSSIPQPIKLETINSCLVSTESFLLGKTLKPSQLNPSTIQNILSHLDFLYKPTATTTSVTQEIKTYQPLKQLLPTHAQTHITSIEKVLQKRFPETIQIIKSPIHGDLTHDNILTNNGNYYFIDFDRSGFGFAEHDTMLLEVYKQTKLVKSADHLILFDQAVKYLNQPSQPASHTLHQLMPAFQPNQSHLPFIKAMFFYRLFVYTLSNNLPETDITHIAKQLTLALQ